MNLSDWSWKGANQEDFQVEFGEAGRDFPHA